MLMRFYTYLTESGNSSCNCSSLRFTILGLGKKFFVGSKLQVLIRTLTTPSLQRRHALKSKVRNGRCWDANECVEF